MPVYVYKGLDERGKAVSGILDAETPKIAQSHLKKKGIYLSEIREESADRKAITLKGVDLSHFLQRIKAEEITLLTRQLATLVAAHIPIVEALSALQEQVDNPRLKVIVSEIREKVNQGASLADAMKGHPRIFSDLYVNMVAAGEQSGALEIVLLRLADYSETQNRLKNKVLSAMTYPVLMMFVGFGIVIFLFVYVIPKITKVFESMKVALPFLTRALIGLSAFCRDFWYLLILLPVAFFFAFRRFRKSPQGRQKVDRLLLRLPIFGKILRMVAISRFARTLATLLKSGVPVLVSIRIVRNIVNNVILMRAIDEARESISEGYSIAEPLRKSGEFPPLLTRMIAIGEKTGNLEEMLTKVSESYDAQVENSLMVLTTLLEPVMILFMGGVVSFIALSILLPLLQLSQIMR